MRILVLLSHEAALSYPEVGSSGCKAMQNALAMKRELDGELVVAVLGPRGAYQIPQSLLEANIDYLAFIPMQPDFVLNSPIPYGEITTRLEDELGPVDVVFCPEWQSQADLQDKYVFSAQIRQDEDAFFSIDQHIHYGWVHADVRIPRYFEILEKKRRRHHRRLHA